jgi:hypothetical protein
MGEASELMINSLKISWTKYDKLSEGLKKRNLELNHLYLDLFS